MQRKNQRFQEQTEQTKENVMEELPTPVKKEEKPD